MTRFLALLSLTAALCAALFAFPKERPAVWDREGAARYLDARMDLWFEKAKKLRTGEGKTACASCHTTLAYMLARPALRREMKVATPTTAESRVLDEAARRLEAPDANQPSYDHTDRKKVESRGSEAVLNALLLANADAAAGRRERSAATRRAFARLWETQRTDGAWDWFDFGLEPFETTDGTYVGAALAAIAAGAMPDAAADRAGLEKLRGYLRADGESQRLFNRVWLLLASARMPDLMTRAQRDALRQELARSQQADGGWSLASLGPWRWSKPAAPYQAPGALDADLLAKSDAFATGLIVYALRQTGAPASQPTAARGLAWLRGHQQDGAWRAHSLNFDREHGGDKGEPWRRMFMSDLATAFAVLALAP